MTRLHPTTIAVADESRTIDLARSAGLFLVYALVTVWWSWPGVWNWSTKVAFDPGGLVELGTADFYLITWTLSWGAHALVTHPAALFDGNTFFPAKLTLAYSEHLLGYAPLFAPVYWASGNPILAINVMAALTYPLAALFMYRLARLYVGDTAAALSGFFYAFTLSRYLSPPHFHVLGSQYFPLILLATEQWLRHARWRYALLLFVALTLQALSSAYFLYAVFLMVCPCVVASAWHHRATLDRRRVVGLLAAGVAATAAVTALMWPFLVLRAQGLVTSYDDEHGAFGLIPVFAKIFLMKVLFEWGIGWIGWALVVVGLLARGVPARWPKRLALLLVVVGCVASLGPRIAVGGRELWSPYVLLRDYVPGFATIRKPGRFAVIADVGLALLLGLGAERILRRARPSVAALAAGAIAVAALALMGPFPELPLHEVPVHGAIPPSYRWLRDHGGGRAVLEVPPGRGWAGAAYRAYLSTAHWQPIVEGYAGNAPVHGRHIYWIAQFLPAADALQRVVDLVDIGWILVHRDQLEPERAAPWASVETDGLELAGEWAGGDVLYRVTLPPRDDHRARLLSVSETVNGLAIEPISGDCAGVIELVDWPELPRQPGDGARAQVLVVNHSGHSWPGLGFLPLNLVALEASVLGRDGRNVAWPWRTSLADDVAPDHPVGASVGFATPRTPGRYVLRLRLIQGSAGSLDGCVAPLEIPFDVPPASVALSHDPSSTTP